MSSVTSWTRLEPGARSDDLAPGLQARIHDPLWMLARQWQLGEFTGEDAGSPVSVRLRAEVAPVARYRPHGGTARPYDRNRPLETAVEAGSSGRLTDLRIAARAGQHFLRLLGGDPALAAYRDRFAAAYPLNLDDGGDGPLDPQSRRWLSVLGPRTPSGAQLLPDLRALAENGTPPTRVTVAFADQRAMRSRARSWLTWLDSLGLTPDGTDTAPPAWDPSRMEYRFEVAAHSGGVDTVFSAPEYDGGRLDWYSFNVDTGATLPAADPIEEPVEEIVRTVLPAPAGYPGMPAARWWEFEDARVDYGRVEAEPTDLSRLLLMEYATVYSNDWYLLPLTLPVASVVRIGSLVVTDTFGFRTLIRPAGALPGDGQDWSLFRHTVTGPRAAAGARSDRFLVAPAIADSLEAEPVEEVRLFRDEMANVAWAVETIVAGATGRRVRRHETTELTGAGAPTGSGGSAVGPGAAGADHYRLATSVPEHWFPLLPVEPVRGAYLLRRGSVPRHDAGHTVDPRPRGELLEPGRDLTIHSEEVPREGLHVTRVHQRARWSDGSTHTWIGRRKRPGRGEGSSGLVFDVVEQGPAG
ncbi:hypothetical protein ADK66_17395 [Micromonospora sp. NRRL B-16802]|uniref:hypothetical protein n=1 Tax=Micromonospora sp. NRRL B-16802 TaxID=1415541 RepID=UPI0006ADCCC0|nr:hypothetical protein [Micromonospora sp. NRRL B-16802]KOX08001.1 hypothetical protein ADK66_17395 [Micromonospora sp. NRRL B-16802]